MGQAAQLAEVADALRTTAGVYTSTVSDLNSTTFILTGVVQELLAGWQGASSQAFVNACNKAWNDEGKISSSLSSTASALTALAGVLENNITSISAYETDSASTTIQPAALQATEQAANLAWAAIASAVAEQAAAIEAAAAQVGVCSIGEGGPWDATGLKNGAVPPGLRAIGEKYNAWINNKSPLVQWLIQTGLIIIANGTSAIVTKIWPNKAGFLIPVLISLGLGASTAGPLLSLIEDMGIANTSAKAIMQSVLGGMISGGAISGAFHFIFYPQALPDGETSDSTRTLQNGEQQEVITYKNGTVVTKDTEEQGGEIKTTETTISSDGKVTTSTTFKPAPVPAPPKTSPTPTTQPTRWGVESRL